MCFLKHQLLKQKMLYPIPVKQIKKGVPPKSVIRLAKPNSYLWLIGLFVLY